MNSELTTHSTINMKDISNNNNNTIDITDNSEQLPVKYYILNNSLNLNIVKLQNNKIKILKPMPMLFPVYINSIVIDEFQNISFSGKLNEIDKILTIKYNKFFINPIIDVI